MNSIIAGLLLAFGISYGTTLQELIDQAVKNSPLLKEKKVDIKIQEAKKKSIKAQHFGELKARITGTKYEDSRILYPLTPPIDPRRLIGAEHQLITALSYTLPLFTGFELRKNTEIASLGKRLKEIDFLLTKNQLIFNVKSTYLKILELEKSLQALTAYKKSLEKLYEDVELAVKIGRKAEVDLLKINYQLEQAKSEISKVKNSINTLKQTLKYLIGSEEIDLSHLEDVKKTQTIFIPDLNRKIAGLDALKKADLSREIAKRKVDIAKGKYLPRIYLNASAQRNMGNSEYKDLWQIGFLIEFTLFDFGKRKNQYIQSKLEMEKARLLKQNLKLKIKKDIVDALNRIKTAESGIKTAKKQVDYAKMVEETEKAKYEEGVSDMFHLLYAKAQKVKAETEYYRAVYEKERAVSYLYYILEEFKNE
ncbi:MAG: TolC family protein [Aquificae bacterium]|nr:TolC family protein [Aquificota bacterium]